MNPEVGRNTKDAGAKRAALIIATLSSFTTPFIGSSVNIALPAIEKQFQIDAVLLSWIPTSYLLAAAVALVPFGRLADIYGRKKIFTYGMGLFTLFSFLSAIAPSAPLLIFFRVLHGIGSAMIFATGIAIITSVFPPTERGKALGINVAAVYVGLSVGPFLGGFLTQHFTWRSVFLLVVPFGLIILVLIKWKLKGEWAEARGESFDGVGALIYAFGVTAVMYGMSTLPSGVSYGILGLGLVGIFAFIGWELRVEAPVFDIALFQKNRIFAFSNLAALINYSATFAVTFLLSLYLQYIKGLSPQQAGLVLIAQPVVMAAFSPLAGRMSDRVEPRIVSSIGMAMTSAGLFVCISLEAATSLSFLIGVLVVLGLGFALFSSPNTNAIMGSVERRHYGIASGSVGTMRLLGMMISMGIVTVVFALLIGRTRIRPDVFPEFVKSMKFAFTIFACLCLGGVFASLVRGKLHVEDPSSSWRA